MTNSSEQFLSRVKFDLVDLGFDYNQIESISNVILLALSDYELSSKCTELDTIDTSSELLVKLYLSTLLTEGKSKKTVNAYANLLRLFLDDLRKPIVDINVFDIRMWLAKRQQTASLRTCENYRAYLSAFYQWLSKEEIIASNPMARIKPIKYIEENKLEFSTVEIDKLRNASQTVRDRAIIELLLSSGIRASELVELNRDDVDFDSNRINVRNGKGGKQRYTYMSELSKEYLRQYLEERTDDNEWLFQSRLKIRISASALRDIVKNIGNVAGVSNVHPHRFRRTFATTFAKREMDVRSIQMLMGHSNVETTMHYISLSDDQVKLNYQKYTT